MKRPSWDLSTEYAGFETPEWKADQAFVEDAVSSIESVTARLRPLMEAPDQGTNHDLLLSGLANLQKTSEDALVRLWNLMSFTSAEFSTNVLDQDAQKQRSRLNVLLARLQEAKQPVQLFLLRAPIEFFEAYLAQEAVAPSRFEWEQRRRQTDLLLSEKEEALLTGLGPTGHEAWGDLYTAISGSMKCEIKHADGRLETVGLSQAQAMTKLGDAAIREAAWKAIDEAWSQQKPAAAAVLNALSGWRLEMTKRRSLKRKIDFLENPLHDARIERRTLDALIAAVEKNIEIPREGARLMAEMHGKSRMDPWDLLAPAPVAGAKEMPFDDAVAAIRAAFGGADPAMGAFVDMAVEKKWIEAEVRANKQGGAYCTWFPKSRTPRVFQTYMGSFKDVSTLAHELGHAYHSWVMRDLPMVQTEYPMTLAETASIFSETVLTDHLIENSKDENIRLGAAYAEAEAAVGLLLNIPARFTFEKSFYEQRANGELSADELSDLTAREWTRWYGDTLSTPDRLFWANKLHFSIAGVSFYNYPYLFGYLFSLSIYARREQLGEGFIAKYIEILRDTGRMTAEELVTKHLGEDIGTPEFWQKSLDVVAGKIANFRRLKNAANLNRNPELGL